MNQFKAVQNSVFSSVPESFNVFWNSLSIDSVTLRWQTPATILFRYGLSFLAPLIKPAHLFSIYGILRRTHREICIKGLQQ